MKSQSETRYLVQVALMAAIVAVVAFVPFLGYIPLVVIKATTVHIPVIIGAILLGPKAGGILGAVFGITSIIKNTMEPSLVSFVFSPLIAVPGTGSGSIKALLVALVPRILIGVVTGIIFKAFVRAETKTANVRIVAGIAAFAGSAVNTGLVMGGIYLLFGQEYAAAKQMAFECLSKLIMTVVFPNGLAEAFVAVVISAAIIPPLRRFFQSNQ